MVSGAGNVPLSLLAIILLFVPGLVGLEVFLFVSQRRRSFSRVHLVVYSSILSISSLFLLYVLTPIYYDGLVYTTDRAAQLFNIVTISELFDASGVNIIAFYILHVFIAGSLGYFSGRGVDWYQEGERDRREPWHYAFAVVPSAGEEIEVVMDDGTIIHGSFNEEAWDESRRELYLDDPEEIEYTDDGSDIDDRTPLGRSILLHEHAISRIVFIEQDPQSEIIDKLEQAEIEVSETFEIFGKALEIDQAELDEFEVSGSIDEDDEESGRADTK